MNAHFPRFLNLPHDSHAFALLGLMPNQCTAAKVEEALRRRIAQTYNHPEGRSEEAEQVRQSLREAAEKLKDPIQRERLAQQYRPPRVRPRLTSFDQEALAILVGSGGWNAISRARLVSLAQHHGITSQGLMKVISGLSRYAREGVGHLETADITAGRPRFAAAGTGPTALDSLRAVSDTIIEKYTPELRDESASATIKLSIVFGLLAIVLAIFFVRILLPEPQPPIPKTVVDPSLVPAGVRSDEHTRDEVQDETSREDRILDFEHLPTFKVELPDAVARHAGACADVPDELAEINRRLSVTRQPSEAVYHLWDAAIADASRGWPLVDGDLLDRIAGGMREVLFLAADSPAVSERLIERLMPPEPTMLGEGDDPLMVLAGAWQIKQLARIAQQPDLPPILGDQARTAFFAAGGESLGMSIDRDSPAGIASMWLDHMAEQSINRLATADAPLPDWELWLAAQRSLGDTGEFERSILAAIGWLLDSTVPLTRSEPALSLLGRLVSELDLSNSRLVKRAVLAFFDDEQVQANRLAVLSAMLVRHPAALSMDESLVLPLNADDVMRRRVRQDLEKAWPAVESDDDDRLRRTVDVEPGAATRWEKLQNAVIRESIAAETIEQMRQLHAAIRLNQAAALLASTDAELQRQGERILDGLRDRSTHPNGFRSERDSGRQPTNTNPRGRGPGVPAGGEQGDRSSDGMWAAAYEAARRHPSDRIEELRALRNRGGDLGRADAAVFVREVYRATPLEVREEAQMILTERFSRGGHVGMFMLDLFPEAPRVELTSNLIVRYTGHTLPDVRSEAWQREARAALIEHVIGLRRPAVLAVDQLASECRGAVLSEAAAVDPSRRDARDAMTPTEAIVGRYRAWRALAGSRTPSSIPVPGDLMTLDRRHRNRLQFADSPIQAYVAVTISTLELITYLASTEQPALSEALHDLLRDAASRRMNAETLLMQAIIAERTIADVWRLRIGGGDDGSANGRTWHQPSDHGRELPMRKTGMFNSLVLSITVSPAGRATVEHRDDSNRPRGENEWQGSLEALDPSAPERYFELAEDMADMADTGDERDLARRLFLFAGVLAPERFGRSAALALAQMEDRRPMRQRLRALADLLDPFAKAAMMDRDPAAIGDETRTMPAVLELGEALSALRLGHGNRASSILRRHAVEALLDRVAHAPSIDPVRLREDAASGRRTIGGPSARIDAELLVELALLRGAARSWSADLALYERTPLIEVDEELLERMLGGDVARPYYRDGRWVRQP